MSPTRSRTTNNSIPIQEIFTSIQGEGKYVGLPSLFIRTSGCNLNCPFCDTDHTSARRMISEPALMKIITKLLNGTKIKHIVITGGEPMINLPNDRLIKLLMDRGMTVQIETNGTCIPSWLEHLHIYTSPNLWITCSPKLGMNSSILRIADEFKILVDHERIHFPIALHSTLSSLAATRRVNFQPITTSDKRTTQRNLRAAITAAENHPHTYVSVQLHKLLNLR